MRYIVQPVVSVLEAVGDFIDNNFKTYREDITPDTWYDEIFTPMGRLSNKLFDWEIGLRTRYQVWG